MKKALILAGIAGVLAVVGLAEGRGVLPELATREMCQTSADGPYMVNLSSHQAVNVASSTTNGAMEGAFFQEVYNNSSTATINCAFNASLSTVSSNANYGREIVSQTGVGFMADFDKVELYCQSQSTVGTTSIDVFQCR